MDFKDQILLGIPTKLPAKRNLKEGVNRAPKRKEILSSEEKKLAIRNALRYFPKEWHQELISEFLEELNEYGRIYMYRFRPTYKMHARAIEDYPSQSIQAASIMLMIQNNLDSAVAQHPE